LNVLGEKGEGDPSLACQKGKPQLFFPGSELRDWSRPGEKKGAAMPRRGNRDSE